jgi:hypothetical protein
MPRTGAQGSTRKEGVNFWRRNQAPGWLVLTWNATRSPRMLMGSSRSLVEQGKLLFFAKNFYIRNFNNFPADGLPLYRRMIDFPRR